MPWSWRQQAAVEAEALFPHDSLVVARLRLDGSIELLLNSGRAIGAERADFVRQSWALLFSTIAILLRRLESDTLLFGTVWEEELDYYSHEQAAILKAKNKPVPPLFVLRARAFTMGYGTLLDAMLMSLDLLRCPWWTATQRRSVESFVLQGLDVIPRTAGVALTFENEDRLVARIERRMNPRDYDPAFCASVLRKWRSNAVSSVLQARGVLQTGIAMAEQTHAEFEALKRAGVAKHGLRDCALPSCSKTEKTVKEFAGCSCCRTVVYCCLEHQALDWKAHKKVCREAEAARLKRRRTTKRRARGAWRREGGRAWGCREEWASLGRGLPTTRLAPRSMSQTSVVRDGSN